MLAARCEVLGWELSRGTLAKIEARVRCITDQELATLALALRINILDLYPKDTATALKRHLAADMEKKGPKMTCFRC
jgi:hypothetical protein